MGSAKNFRLGIPLALTAYVLSGPACIDLCPNGVDVVSVTGPNDSFSASVWPGDQLNLRASAITLNEFCSSDLLYTSTTRPSAFTFISSDTTIATVSQEGAVTAKRLGTANITVKAGGQSNVFLVSVIVPVTAIAVIATPTTAHPGDTVSVSVTATGPDGATVSAPDMQSLTWRGSGVSSGPWLPGLTATSGRFQVTTLGTVTITAVARATVHGTHSGTTQITSSPP